MLRPRLAEMSVFILAGVVLLLTANILAEECSDQSFELHPGRVYEGGTLLRELGSIAALDVCLQACLQEPQCQAFNYRPRSCQLLQGLPTPESGGSYRVENAEGWRVMGEKICVKGCGKGWSVETLAGSQLSPHPQAITYPASSRVECIQICLSHETFPCRSANYHREEKKCVVSPVDRFKASEQSHTVSSNEEVDYIESNCVANSGNMCQFASRGGFTIAAVDSVQEGVKDWEDCKDLCHKKEEFTCRSYDLSVSEAGLCRLSHSTALLPHEAATSYQLTACYNVSIHCGVKAMSAKISTDQLFHGKVYAKSRPNSCVSDVGSDTDFQLDLGFNDLDCDVRQESPGKFSSDIIIQHHDQIVTDQDLGLSIRCSYNLGNRSIGHGVELTVGGEPGSVGTQESSFVLSPTVTMRITDRHGGDIHTAQVGDPLSLRFKILDPHTPYEIFVRELIALDGVDSSEILLIDGEGCPTDPTIMGAVSMVTGQDGERILEAPFDAFKFPTSDLVQFKALVTPCLPTCGPVSCKFEDFFGAVRRTDSFGKRKKRQTSDFGRDEVVVKTIRIQDKFRFETPSTTFAKRPEDKFEENAAMCSSKSSVALVVCLLLSGQLILCFLCYTLLTKWRPRLRADNKCPLAAAHHSVCPRPWHKF